MAGERDWVLVEIDAGGIKLHYIFEKEFAEHLAPPKKAGASAENP